MKKIILLTYLLFLLCNTNYVMAQTEPEQIIMANNDFEDFFYESLKQKAIENYDKAILALELCLKIEPQNATVNYELGKNYLAQKDYLNAFTFFEKATQIDPTNKWFWIGMYDVVYETKDFKRGVDILNRLIPFDPKFKEDLTSVYMNTGQYDKALELINELNQTVGKTERRESYKFQILSQGKFQKTEIDNLIEQIEKNPKEESNYTSLIYLYSKNNEIAKVYETAKKLESQIPTSVWAQVSLFKFNLENKEGNKAVLAMNIVLESPKIEFKIKHRILNEFLIFTNNNPQYTPDLDKAIRYFDTDPDINVAKEIGKYYHTKKIWEKAIQYYEKAIQKDKTIDIESNLLLIECYIEVKKFDVVLKKSEELIGVYPTQPQLYYYEGLCYNQLKDYKTAKKILETGLDYLVDDPTLEVNFYVQLGEAYLGLGDLVKKDLYFTKAKKILDQQTTKPQK